MPETWANRIQSDPLVLHGKPCIRGTRIPVALVLGYLAAGYSVEATIEEFPDLSREDIFAALNYARDLADFNAVEVP